MLPVELCRKNCVKLNVIFYYIYYIILLQFLRKKLLAILRRLKFTGFFSVAVYIRGLYEPEVGTRPTGTARYSYKWTYSRLTTFIFHNDIVRSLVDS